MSAKKGRRGKVLPAAADDSQKASSLNHLDSANLSAIERASFMEGLQLNYGNPLHSTAVEEDLEVSEEGRVNKGRAGKKDIPAKRRGAAEKRKETEADGESEKEEQQQQEKKKKRSTGGRVKARPEKGGVTKKKKGETDGERRQSDEEGMESDPSTTPQESNQPTPTAAGLKRLVGKKPAKGRSVRQTPAARPVKNQQKKKDKKRKSESGKSSDPQSQEESDSDTGRQKRKRVLSSDEEEVEDTSWKPSPKKDRVYSLGRTRKSSSGRSKSRKSSSGSASAEPEQTNRVERKKKRRQGGTQLEVVLDAFLHFCDQYRESVESKAVKQSIDSFSSNVREQLTEKISSHKELRVLKRENTKVGSLIRTKTQRLLDAKHELMRAERQALLLQKEKAELELRLADLRRSHSFLRDIRELNRQYLDYRHTHPKEKEMYGASSLPALLLEARHIQGAEHQLRGINNQLEKRLKENGK